MSQSGASVLTIVHAYRDDGWMSELTRWKPRKVYCTDQEDHSDKPGTMHVVKFRRGETGTAALISELVCGELIRCGGLAVLDARLVKVGPGFAQSYKTKPEIGFEVTEGLHFATKLRKSVENGPPAVIEDLADPQELLDLWAFDSWLCTIDRVSDGNILLSLGETGKFHLIAADQSDCFGGAIRFANGEWRQVLQKNGAAPSVPFLDRAIFQAGAADAIRKATDKVRMAAGQIQRAIERVPRDWWLETKIIPAELATELEQRSRRIDEILDLGRWEGLNDAIRGGLILNDPNSTRGPKT
jgi:hypothetical protein